MTGRIIYEPERPTVCDRGQCEDIPDAEGYRAGTIWQCDQCSRKWEVRQYHNSLSTWRLAGHGHDGRGPG